jgi:hypothetical protein
VGIEGVEIEEEGFTFVILGHLNLPEKALMKNLKEIVKGKLQPRDKIVIGLRRWKKLEGIIRLVKEELGEIVSKHVVKVCEAAHHHQAWRELWRHGLVSKEFILIEALESLESGWREWLERMRKGTPDAILSLQGAPADEHGFTITTDVKNQFVVSQVPRFTALSPSSRVWEEFLAWFDSSPFEPSRLSATSHEFDIPDDGWNVRPLGYYSGYAKSFAQFAARTKRVTFYALPALATCTYDEKIERGK